MKGVRKMKVIVAPDSFKGSLTAEEFCEVVDKSIHKIYPQANVHKVPMADGGEGTVSALVYNTGGSLKHIDVTGPLGDKVTACYGLLGSGKTAVVEMASASGLPLVPSDQRDPKITTTYGTGEVIAHIVDNEGCDEIILGIGGSATNDGGAGMLQALGFDLLDSDGLAIPSGNHGLAKLHSIGDNQVSDSIKNLKLVVACDVNNPLCGPEGATYVYGPQKGAGVDELQGMDQNLEHFAIKIEEAFGKKVANVPGAGAAGGLGAGLLGFFEPEMKQGYAIVQAYSGIEDLFKGNDIDLVITGEGEINHQTVNGKLPAGIASLANSYNVPCIAFVGKIGEGAEQVYSAGLTSIFSIVPGPCTLEEAMVNGKSMLEDLTLRVMRLLSRKPS